MLRYLKKLQRISGVFLADMPNDVPYILCCDWNFSPRVNPLRTAQTNMASNWPVCIFRAQVNTKRFLVLLFCDWAEKKQKFSGTNKKPELLRPFGTGPLKPCPQGLFLSFLTFPRPNFFLGRLDFFPPPGWMLCKKYNVTLHAYQAEVVGFVQFTISVSFKTAAKQVRRLWRM